MGCFVSTLNDSGERRCLKNVGELAVFVPGLRIPKPVDFAQPASGDLSGSLVERLSALRTRIVVMASQGAPMTIRPRRAATRHGGSTLADLQQALEDYLPVLLGLVESGNQLQHDWQFSWINQEDGVEVTTMSNSWYEVLSVLQLMAMLSLSQANLLLLSNRSTNDDYYSKLSEECRRASIDIFLKAAGYLDFTVEHVLPQFPSELRNDLPLDLAEGTLRALCLQALGQAVDIQLGMAIDSFEATLAVKRRLACEMVKYWQQAQENIMDLPLASGWGEKHKLFIQWKYAEAKAAAYYLHGLINNEGNAENSNEMAVTALLAAEEFLIVSKKACEAFHLASPVSRNSPLLGANKYLSDKIPKDFSSRVASTQLLQNHERIVQAAPTLPDFALSLKPDEYQLPPVDPSWNDFFKDRVPTTRV